MCVVSVCAILKLYYYNPKRERFRGIHKVRQWVRKRERDRERKRDMSCASCSENLERGRGREIEKQRDLEFKFTHFVSFLTCSMYCYETDQFRKYWSLIG
eukprot:sb/3478729/